jgi:hypothetical protein
MSAPKMNASYVFLPLMTMISYRLELNTYDNDADGDILLQLDDRRRHLVTHDENTCNTNDST